MIQVYRFFYYIKGLISYLFYPDEGLSSKNELTVP